MKTLFIHVTILAFCLLSIAVVWYYEYDIPGLGLLACFILPIGGGYLIFRIIPDAEDSLAGFYLILLGFVLFFTTFIHLDSGIRALPEGKSIKMVTSFYPIGRVLAVGERIDTIRGLACCYKEDEESRDTVISYEDIYILTNEKDSFVMFNHNNMIIKKGIEPEFSQKDFGHGKLDVCSFRDRIGKTITVDLEGNDIYEQGYKPRVIIYIPIVDVSPNY